MLTKFRNEHPNIFLLVVSFLFAFISLLSCSVVTSFVYPLTTGLAYYNDGTMFVIMGKSMINGYKPYIDIYDHKGLYIYYYTMIAGLFGIKGVFIVQLLLQTVTFFFIYKAMRLHTSDNRFLFAAMLIYAGFYTFAGQAPNDADLELPLIAISLYFYTKGILNNDYKSLMFGNIVIGICTGIALNLRVSDALLPFAFVVFYAVKAIKDKKYIYILRDAGIVVAGIIAMSIIPLIHSLIGGFFNDMVEAVYLSNFKYITTTGDREGGIQIVTYIALPLFYLVTFLLTFFKRKEILKDEMLFILITTGVAFVLELIIAFYLHYLIILFPFISVVLVRLLSLYHNEESKVKLGNLVFFSLAAFFIASLTFNPIMYGVTYQKEKNTVDYIKENIEEEARKNGNVLVFASPAYYESCNIKIGYGDFACQFNHIMISERYGEQVLIDYLNSEDCLYYITTPNKEKLLADLNFNHEEYVAIPSEKAVNVTIYRHVI